MIRLKSHVVAGIEAFAEARAVVSDLSRATGVITHENR